MMSTLSNNMLGSMFGFPDAPFIRDTKRAFRVGCLGGSLTIACRADSLPRDESRETKTTGPLREGLDSVGFANIIHGFS